MRVVMVGVFAAISSPAQPVPAESKAASPQARAHTVPASIESSPSVDVLQLTVGRSAILTAAATLRRVYVGNPESLGIYTSGSSEVVLTAKDAGVSTLILWDEAGGRRMYTVFANVDAEALQASLVQAFPESLIQVEAAQGKIFLSGSVESAATAEAAVKLASQFAKNVVSSLLIVPVHSVVEVDRTRMEQLGINIFAGGRTSVSTTTNQFASGAAANGSSFSVSDPLNIFLYNAKLNVGLTIQDLEEKQVLQVLAEPTLTTLSGVSARFLAGGEFPFPVIQPGGGAGSSAAVTIQFRPYGVKVEFTPWVNADGTIHLKLAPEVSTLDYSNAVTISGFTIPALSTRRAETEVELRDGESFAVSGLLDHRTTEILSKVPGIGDLPVLGDLFRSKNVNHSVVELVVIVTATIVDPLGTLPVTENTKPTFVVPNLDPNAFDASFFGGAHSKPQTVPQARTPGEKP
jgi:pilus assembly protein CpaC